MNAPDPEVIDVRAEERIDTSELEPYLRDRLSDVSGPFALRQFAGGHANLTYLVSFGDREFVLRRPPLGPVPAHAHDMRREHAVLSRLYAVFPLAPRSFFLCTDHSIIGSDFVVEQRKHGIAIRSELPERFVGNEFFAKRLGEAIVDTLAALHSVDVPASGLGEMGRPDGYVQRQLDGWCVRWDAARTARSANAGEIIAWLRDAVPDPSASALVHNDFKLDNMLLDADDPSRVVALLDWDMCTYGDPLMDLGYMLALWPESGDPPAFRTGAMPTWHHGFPTRAQAVARYARTTGFSVDRVAWYHIFNVFRFGAILQQIYKRFEAGQTHDERFRDFGTHANALVGAATILARRTGV
jgi:aminoglycoside phosphotransferase (APT) family kinase protein